jgi:hypothetical protein
MRKERRSLVTSKTLTMLGKPSGISALNPKIVVSNLAVNTIFSHKYSTRNFCLLTGNLRSIISTITVPLESKASAFVLHIEDRLLRIEAI